MLTDCPKCFMTLLRVSLSNMYLVDWALRLSVWRTLNDRFEMTSLGDTFSATLYKRLTCLLTPYMSMKVLNHPLMSYDAMDLIGYCFRLWLGAWRHQAITWSNVDVSSTDVTEISNLIHGNAFENIICKMVVISTWPKVFIKCCSEGVN